MERFFEGSVEAVVAAPVDRVWALFADVERMGDLSPECHRVEWLTEERGVGAQFEGHNRIGDFEWCTVSDIVEWTPPTALAWEASGHGGGKKLTRWRYSFEPRGAGATAVTVSFRTLELSAILAPATDEQLEDRKRRLEPAVREPLAAAERVLTADADPERCSVRSR